MAKQQISPPKRYHVEHPVMRVTLTLHPITKAMMKIQRELNIPLTGDVVEDAKALLNAIAQ